MSKWKEEEIGKIPEDAILMELGNCIDLIIDYRGKTPKKLDSDWTSEGIRTISAKNVHKGKLTNIEDIRYVTYDVYKKWMKEDLKIGDCLVASEGATLGEHLYWDFDFPVVLGQRLFCIRTNPKIIDSKYFYAFVTSNYFQNQIHGRASGTSVFGLRQTEVLKMLVPIIPIEKQIPIGEFHYTVNKKIGLLERQNATLEAMAETLFRQWFVEEAKEDWEETSLEKHTEVFRGLSYKGSGLTEKGLGIPMHNLNSVNEGGGYKYEGIKFYSGDFRERHLVNIGDIIVTNTEQGHEFKLIGFPAIVPNSFGGKGLFSQHIYKLIPLIDSYLSNEFIYYLLMTSSIREQVIAATNGSTVNMLAIDGIKRPVFRLPPQAKVKEFTSITSNYWNKKNINQTQIRTLTSLRDTLLPKLMSGEVWVEIN